MNNNFMNLGDYATVIMLLDEVYGGSLDAMIQDIGMQAVMEAAPYISKEAVKKATPKIVLTTLAAAGVIAVGAFGIKHVLSKKKEKEENGECRNVLITPN